MSQVGKHHGLIVHVGARTDTGLLAINLWPSREESEAATGDPRRPRVLEQAQVRRDQIHREHVEPAQFVVFGTSWTALGDRLTPPGLGSPFNVITGRGSA